MSKELEELNKTTKKIETCLVGDKLTGQVGLVDKVDCLGEDVCEIKEKVKLLEAENKTTIKIKKPKWLSVAATFFGIYKA